MKKSYKPPTIELWICVKDVLTMSTDRQGQYDDKETWKGTWFNE